MTARAPASDSGLMRTWVALIASSVFVGLVAAGGCSIGEDPEAKASTTATVGSGTTNYFACNGGQPDGRCNARGDVPETCECTDCQLTAFCLNTCNNDGTCGFNPDAPVGGEDCTCDDCWGVHPDCPPFAECNGDGTCDPGEPPGCSDCATPATTNTTTGGGMGGMGGAGSGGAGGGMAGAGGA